MDVSLDLNIDGGKMFVIALGPLRFDAQQVIAGLANGEMLPGPHASLRLQRERESPFNHNALSQAGNIFLSELAFLDDVVVHTGVSSCSMRIHVGHDELHGDSIPGARLEHGSGVQASLGRRLIRKSFLSDSVRADGQQFDVEVLGTQGIGREKTEHGG